MLGVGQNSKVVPLKLTFEHSWPCVTLFPWVWTGSNGLLSTKRLQQKWRVCHLWDYVMRLWLLLTLSYLRSLMETNGQVMSCPLKRPAWQGTEGDLQPTASEELRLSCNDLWGTENYQSPHEWAWSTSFPSWGLSWSQLTFTAVHESPQKRGPS